jgi:hypothetical protein
VIVVESTIATGPVSQGVFEPIFVRFPRPRKDSLHTDWTYLITVLLVWVENQFHSLVRLEDLLSEPAGRALLLRQHPTTNPVFSLRSRAVSIILTRHMYVPLAMSHEASGCRPSSLHCRAPTSRHQPGKRHSDPAILNGQMDETQIHNKSNIFKPQHRIAPPSSSDIPSLRCRQPACLGWHHSPTGPGWPGYQEQLLPRDGSMRVGHVSWVRGSLNGAAWAPWLHCVGWVCGERKRP